MSYNERLLSTPENFEFFINWWLFNLFRSVIAETHDFDTLDWNCYSALVQKQSGGPANEAAAVGAHFTYSWKFVPISYRATFFLWYKALMLIRLIIFHSHFCILAFVLIREILLFCFRGIHCCRVRISCVVCYKLSLQAFFFLYTWAFSSQHSC